QRFPYAAVQALLLWLSFIICFIAGAHVVQTRRDVQFFLRVLLIVSAAASLVAVIQYAFTGEMRLDFFIGAEQRIISTFGNATFFSSYIVLVVPLFLAAVMHSGSARWLRVSSGVLVAVLLLLLILTATRTSLVALVLSLVVFFARVGERSRKITIFSAMALVFLLGIGLVAFPKLGERFADSLASNSTLLRRVQFWEAGWKAFADAPLVGHGIGSYETTMLSYRPSDYWISSGEDVTQHAHNEFIEVLAETGIIGFLAYGVLVVYAVRKGLRSLKSLRHRERLFVWGIVCSLLGIAIDGLASISLRTAPVGALAWFLLGLLASSWPKEEKGAAPVLRKSVGWEWIAAVAWILFAVWYTPDQLNLIRSSQHEIEGMLSKYEHNLPARIREYEAAVQLAPHDAQKLSRLIAVLVKIGNYEQALNYTEQLQRQIPIYPKSNFQEAIAAFSLRRYHEAIDAARAEIRLRDHPDAFFVLARSHARLNDTVGERQALLGLLDADLRGNTALHLNPTSQRLLDLMRSAEERKTLDSIYRNLHMQFPDKTVVQQTLHTLDSLAAQDAAAINRRFP
ncbi:MAG: O-antigen ligase family protein, partial [Ignavibacteriae bacterium]|nr:O-antigen ligase family protein [Ignavibacteriota bacterium]